MHKAPERPVRLHILAYPPIAQEQVPSNHRVSSVVIGRKNRASLKVESVLNYDLRFPRHPYGCLIGRLVLIATIVLLQQSGAVATTSVGYPCHNNRLPAISLNMPTPDIVAATSTYFARSDICFPHIQMFTHFLSRTLLAGFF